jgi:signal transduction histidine kinase
VALHRVLHDLTHLGVAPDTPPSDAKYIILTNSVSFLGLLVSLLYFPVNLSVEGNLSIQLVPPLASSAGFSLPPWLNYRRYHWAATTLMCLAAYGTQTVYTFAFGTAAGNHFYFLPFLGGMALLYPPRYRKTAGLFVLIGLISFIAIVLWGDIVTPLVPFRDDVAQKYYVLALIISAALVAFISYYANRRTLIVEAQVAARSRELVRTIRELQATQAQMIEAENQAVLARLVAGLLHEINTPLGSIRSAADTMAGAVTRWERIVTQHADPSHPEGEAALRALEVAPQLRDSLHEGATRLSTVVEGLRQFVGLDEAERKPLDVRKGIDGALSLLGPSVQGRIDVIRDYAETLPEVVCRPAKLNRAFLSVLQNAVQAIEGRGVLRVSVRALDGRIEIDVVDDGKGIPASKMPEIFELGLTRKAGRVGLRLGLPMSKRCIEELGGQLAVESVEGVGTTVRMTLPVATS